MGLLGSILGTAIDIAVLPVRLAVDVVNLPETADDPKRGPLDNTTKGLKDIVDDIL